MPTRLAPADGQEKLVALLPEGLAVATRIGAAKPSDFPKVIVDTGDFVRHEIDEFQSHATN